MDRVNTKHPKWDQNLQITPLSETTSIPVTFIWEFLAGRTLIHWNRGTQVLLAELEIFWMSNQQLLDSAHLSRNIHEQLFEPWRLLCMLNSHRPIKFSSIFIILHIIYQSGIQLLLINEIAPLFIVISVASLSILAQLFTQHFYFWQFTDTFFVVQHILNNESQRFLNNESNE